MTAFPNRSSWLPGSSSFSWRVSTKPDAGMPETSHRALKTGSSVLRAVMVRNEMYCAPGAGDCGGGPVPATETRGETVARM